MSVAILLDMQRVRILELLNRFLPTTILSFFRIRKYIVTNCFLGYKTINFTFISTFIVLSKDSDEFIFKQINL